jgi:Phage tail assembly chaperone protein
MTKTYTFFGPDGLPIQQAACTDDEAAVHAEHLGAAHAISGSHLQCRLVDGVPVPSDPRSQDRALADLRMARDAALRESDVLALRELESSLSPGLQAYREALRNLPATSAGLDQRGPIRWPTKPA